MSLNHIDQIELIKIFWEKPEFNVPKFAGLKLEFDAFYKEQKKFELLLKSNPEVRGLSVNDLPKYGIGEEFFGFDQQLNNFLLTLLQVIIENSPLTKAAAFTNIILNELEEMEINSSFESSVNIPLKRKYTEIEETKLFRAYLKKKNKPFIEKVKKILLNKQNYFKSLGIQKTYKQEDYELLNHPHVEKSLAKAPSQITTVLEPEIKNYFDLTGIDIVYNHFKKGLVDKGELSEEDLKLYLKAAFEDRKPPKKLFRFKNNRTRKELKKPFILYWQIVGKPYKERTRYVELLSKYFEGFSTKELKDNWKIT